MTDSIPARLAALKTTPLPELKAQCRELFETDPPQFNRRALENRLAYRIQELAYGGLKPETIRRLEILGEQYDSDNVTTRRIRNEAKPVAGTQSFNTTTSMGRLTLNILLSFAQFEREVTAERIRDKIRALRQKGMFMGGNVPLGYAVKDRKLVVSAPEAAIVRSIFERFVRIGSATVLARKLRQEGVGTKRGKLVDKGYLSKLLNNRTYLGLAVHKGTAHPGEHAAIIEQDLWDKVHAILAENTRTRSANTRAQTPALLRGLLFGPTGAAMSPTHTRNGNRLYRYYVSQDVLKRGPDACPVGRVPAAEIEAAVIDQLRGIFRQPEIIVGTWRAARGEQDDITEDEAREALLQLDPLWDELFPAEQARIVQLLVERVDMRMNGVEVRLRPNGLAGLVREVAGSRRAAA